MKFNLPLPFDRAELGDEFQGIEAIREVSQLAEKVGFNAGLVTDHPCPTGRWLDAGGHYAHDPFVTLSLVAAVTTTLRLQTGILVLPYRNPFITARAVATLDRFSGGRVSLGFGAGYLKGEYKALGVDFDQRNEIMDEYMRALKAALSGEEFTFEGTGYTALGNRIQPGPIQTPHPPFLVGGNAPRAIRRAVELGDAWNPFFTVVALSSTARTKEMTGPDDVREGIAYMRAHCEKVGRETPPEVVLGSISPPGEKPSPAEIIDRAGLYREMGVSAVGMSIDGRSRAEFCDNLQRFGEEVIAKAG